MNTADEIIAHLSLKPHPAEGGYYVETYRSKETIPANVLGRDYSGDRAYGTAIYYLLTDKTFSALHKLPGDEIFHFYLGDPVEMLQLEPDGTGRKVILGTDLQQQMRPQIIVPGGVWQGSRLLPGSRFALLGTTMAPGFDFADYIPGRRADLIAQYPKFEDAIIALTHSGAGRASPQVELQGRTRGVSEETRDGIRERRFGMISFAPAGLVALIRP